MDLGFGTLSGQQGWKGHTESSGTGGSGKRRGTFGKVWGWMSGDAWRNYCIAELRPQQRDQVLTDQVRSDPHRTGMTMVGVPPKPTPAIKSNMISLSQMVLERTCSATEHWQSSLDFSLKVPLSPSPSTPLFLTILSQSVVWSASVIWGMRCWLASPSKISNLGYICRVAWNCFLFLLGWEREKWMIFHYANPIFYLHLNQM